MQASIITSSPELLKIKRKKEEIEAKKTQIKIRKEMADQKKLKAAKKLILAQAKKITENENVDKKPQEKKSKRTKLNKILKKGESTNIESEKPNLKNEKVQRRLFDDRNNEDSDCVCPGCNMIFENPPTEDWIQCYKCETWWYENCTSYERSGDYLCDLCP